MQPLFVDALATGQPIPAYWDSEQIDVTILLHKNSLLEGAVIVDPVTGAYLAAGEAFAVTDDF